MDPTLPAKIAYARARHLILSASTRERLVGLDHDFEGLKEYMIRHDLFPVGGMVEDPATGAAAAALGAHLREIGAVTPPAGVTIVQGEA